MGIVAIERSIIPSVDLNDISKIREMVRQTHDVEGIGGYKLNAASAVLHGLPKLAEIVREFTNKPIIYDHQKWMTDVPHTGIDMINAVKDAGAQAIIGFPLSGPETQETYIKEAQKNRLAIIVGGEMTHPQYKTSEGGYISDEMLDKMYLTSARLGVSEFVVPGNKPERVKHYLDLLRPEVRTEISLWAPGFVAQGGEISEAGRAAGRSFHAIVGRGIYTANDMHAEALRLTSKLNE
jgi:orotidine-5'-phosphate decarboxylase